MFLHIPQKTGERAGKASIMARLSGILAAKEKWENSKSSNLEIQEILECVKNARKEWLSACNGFEYADSQDVIDYYTYKIKAHELQYEYFLKKAKEMGIKAENIG